MAAAITGLISAAGPAADLTSTAAGNLRRHLLTFIDHAPHVAKKVKSLPRYLGELHGSIQVKSPNGQPGTFVQIATEEERQIKAKIKAQTEKAKNK